MYGSTVLGIDSDRFETALEAVMHAEGAALDVDLGVSALEDLVAAYREIILEEAGRDFPQSPAEQLAGAVRAVFHSWNTERARLYRRQERIPEDLGTAVNVQVMVFGNRGPDSGSGVCFTRDPATGHPGAYGDYLGRAQGEDCLLYTSPSPRD